MSGSGQHKLILLTSWFPFVGGETFLESEIGYLSEAFDEVLIISSGSGGMRPFPGNCKVIQASIDLDRAEKLKATLGIFHPLVREEIKIIRTVYRKKVTKQMLFTILVSWRQSKKIEKLCQDFLPKDRSQKVYFYSYWTDSKALGIARLQQNHPEITAFSRMHGWDVYFESSQIGYLPFRHFLARNLKRIFAISEKGKAYAENTWKIPDSQKVSVSRLGVPKQEATQNQPDVVFTLVSCSNLISLKRVNLIIDALALIGHLKIKWTHFGDGVLLDELTQSATEKLKDNICADIKGRLSNREILGFYRKTHVDLFINVSSTEGIPVSIMEAMSFGIPALATNVGGTSEIVTPENGILLDADPTSEQIAAKILLVEGLDEGAKSQLRANARQTSEEKYNDARNYTAFIETVKRL